MASKAVIRRDVHLNSRLHSPIQLKRVSTFTQAHTCSRFQLSSIHSASRIYSSSSAITSKRHKFATCRMKLQLISGCLAGISLLLSLASHWLVGRESSTVSVVFAVCSLAQIWLVISYWVQEEKWVSWTNRTVGTTLLLSKKSRILCGLECLLHLLIPLPKEFILLGFSVNSISYALLVFRNCHTLRWFYWISPFSSLRASVYCAWLNVGTLTWKHCLKRGSGVIVGLTVLSLWLLLDVLLEQEIANIGWKALARLGEDQSSISKPYNQVVLMILACVGAYLLGTIAAIGKTTMVLTHAEALLSDQLRKVQDCQPFETRAAELLQAWWRLTQMRLRHRLNIEVVFTWYRTLLARRPLYRDVRAGYSLYSHLAAIQKGMQAKIKRILVPPIIMTRLNAMIRSEVLILKRANYVAGRRGHTRLPQRLSTIREAENEQSSPVAHPPHLAQLFLR